MLGVCSSLSFNYIHLLEPLTCKMGIVRVISFGRSYSSIVV